MTVGLPSADKVKRVGVIVVALILCATLLAAGFLLLSRLMPKYDPTPIVTARKDERKAAGVGEAIGQAATAQAHESAVHVDITTKEIRDAFQAVPPALVAPAGDDAPLPAAPVDRLRDQINAGIARANRAAGDAGAPE